ncbi:MAG TPA: hypothetical protein VM689_11505 [Aliidongia sp.]|nr:hypothetical protein [Aliidongia sp.]
MSDLRLSKLRAVVSREGKDAPPPTAAAQPATKPAAEAPRKPKASGRSVRTSMLIAIGAWTLIMPVMLVGLILARRGEGALPNLPILAVLHSAPGVAIVEAAIGLWVTGLLYFLPSIVAALRRHPFFIWILLLDILVSGLLLLSGWFFGLWAVILGAAIWTPGQRFHQALGRMAAARKQ